MRYFMLCICLGVTHVLGKEDLEESKQLGNQHNIKSETTKRSELNLENILTNPYKSVTIEPLTIRARIPPDLVIPSVSTANNLGSNSGIQISPSLNGESYSADSLAALSFGDGFPIPDFKYLPNLIPVQQISSNADFNSILNLDTGIGVGAASLEIKPIENLDSILNSASVKQNINSFSIEKATLGFNENNNVKVATHSPITTNGFYNLGSLKGNTNSENIPLTKFSYSIEKVPEVASFHRTGPLVPSDIPSISEIEKLFNTKVTKLPSLHQETIHNDTQTAVSKLEKSDDDISDLIEQRIGTYNGAKTLSNESFTTDEVTITKNNINRTKSNELQKNDSLFSSSKNIVNVLDKLPNEKQNDKLDNSTGSLESQTSENTDIEELAIPESSVTVSLSNNTSADNLQKHLSNETLLAISVPVIKLNASSFLNANDILTENSTTNEVSVTKNIINRTKCNKLRNNANISTSSKNVSNDIDTLQNEKPDNKLGNSTVGVGSRIAENTEIEAEKTESPITISPNNNTSADDSQEQLLNETHLVTSVPVTKLNASDFLDANDILKETSEFKAIIKSTESPIFSEQSSAEIPSNLVNSSQHISLETELSSSENASASPAEPLSINAGSLSNNISLNVKNLNDTQEGTSLNSPVLDNKLYDNLLNKNKTSDVETSVKTIASTLLESGVKISTITNEPQNLVTNISNIIFNQNIKESQFSKNNIEEIADHLSNKSVTIALTLGNVNNSKNDTINTLIETETESATVFKKLNDAVTEFEGSETSIKDLKE